jgi:hypothetical protein
LLLVATGQQALNELASMRCRACPLIRRMASTS